MASSKDITAATATEADITALKNAIYEGCTSIMEDDPDAVFHQQDLLDFGVIPKDDVALLLKVAQALADEKLFKIVMDQEGVGWKYRTQEEAKKYRSLKPEHEMVYSLIDEAGSEGIWSKTIKAKSNLHDAVFRAAIKHLESKGMISDMKSVEHPMRKLYIKSSIRPSDRSTGGSWYTDSELDEAFIDQLMDVLYKHIRSRSFYRSSSGSSLRKPNKRVKMSVEEVKSARDKSLGQKIKKEDHEEDDYVHKKRKYDSLWPMPPGYHGYPTLNELTAFIENSKITSTTLSATDIQQLLDILCYDDRIERIIAGPEAVAYRAVRKSLKEEEEGPGNGLTDAPCGRCPVFDLCAEGGPVGPSNCEYYTEWLGLGLD
ncbi:RNA polymerase Rpc34 [Xylogone sp. PMI_703]|nr:RNA polymerase Rpc34 [Xylogone sp. PMI_703]